MNVTPESAPRNLREQPLLSFMGALTLGLRTQGLAALNALLLELFTGGGGWLWDGPRALGAFVAGAAFFAHSAYWVSNAAQSRTELVQSLRRLSLLSVAHWLLALGACALLSKTPAEAVLHAALVFGLSAPLGVLLETLELRRTATVLTSARASARWVEWRLVLCVSAVVVVVLGSLGFVVQGRMARELAFVQVSGLAPSPTALLLPLGFFAVWCSAWLWRLTGLAAGLVAAPLERLTAYARADAVHDVAPPTVGCDILSGLEEAVRMGRHALQSAVARLENDAAVERTHHSRLRAAAERLQQVLHDQAVRIDSARQLALNLSLSANEAQQYTEQLTLASTQQLEATGESTPGVETLLADVVRVEEQNRAIVDAARRLDRHMKECSAFLASVQTVASRSELLALSAGLELTRAQEGNERFAQVSGETAALSSRVFSSSREMEKLLEEILAATESTLTISQRGLADTLESRAQAVAASRAVQAMVGLTARTQEAAEMLHASNSRYQAASLTLSDAVDRAGGSNL